MNNREFSSFRQKFQKTQKQMAELLGTSLKAVQSFEQGWRKVPVHIERQMLFLASSRALSGRGSRPCWEIRECPGDTREACPAWEFNMGQWCWFINGTICRGEAQGSWVRKMKVCRNCEVFVQTMKPEEFPREKKSKPAERRGGARGNG